jgi:hypothetical protein
LFLAHASGGRWHIALSGTAEFEWMLGSASATVLTIAEKQLLARFNTAQTDSAPAGGAPSASSAPPASSSAPVATAPPGGSAAPTGTAAPGGPATPGGNVPRGATDLALPWRGGQSWRLVAAFSGSGTGQATMIAFSGGNGRVLAAGPGRLYRFCGGRGSAALIEIIHPDGSATEYYQLRAETRARDGSLVSAGTFLGMAGTSLACGAAMTGSGPGPGVGTNGKTSAPEPGAVSFAVIARGNVLNLNGLILGGWTFHQQTNPPLVWAQRAAVRVPLGGLLKNFGAAPPGAAVPAPVPAPSPTPSPSPSPSSSPGMS